MKIKEFFYKWNGKGIDYDGYAGFQCVDLYRQYCQEVLKLEQSPGVKGAYQIWTTYRKSDFEKIKNTPKAVPQLGDIIVWSREAGGGYGHVAIFNYGDVDSFVSFDQNFPTGSLCHFQNHNYGNVLGWLRPKNFNFESVEINDQTKIDMGKPHGLMEVQAIRSKLNDQERAIKNLNGEILGIEKANNAEISQNDFNWQSKLDTANSKIQKLEQNTAENLDKWTLLRIVYQKFVKGVDKK